MITSKNNAGLVMARNLLIESMFSPVWFDYELICVKIVLDPNRAFMWDE
jgi:hypothetical protein